MLLFALVAVAGCNFAATTFTFFPFPLPWQKIEWRKTGFILSQNIVDALETEQKDIRFAV
jgi:hypothetical protein